jgi:hypothetical protein
MRRKAVQRRYKPRSVNATERTRANDKAMEKRWRTCRVNRAYRPRVDFPLIDLRARDWEAYGNERLRAKRKARDEREGQREREREREREGERDAASQTP